MKYTRDNLRLLGHHMLLHLEAIDVSAAPRRPKLGQQLEENIEELRSIIFRMIGTKDPADELVDDEPELEA